MNKILLILLLCIGFIIKDGQAQTYISDFDGTDQLTITTSNVTTKSANYSAPAGAVTGVSGNGGEVRNTTGTITTASITTTGTTDFTFDLQSASGTSSNGADGTDFVKVEVSVNGGTSFTDQLTVKGNSNARWLYNSAAASVIYANAATEFAPASGGDRTSDGDGYSKIQVSAIPAGDVVIKITLKNNSSKEYWCVDNLKLQGNSSSSISISPSSIDLTYQQDNGPSTSSNFQISGTNLSQDITMSLNGDTNFEWKKTSESTYSSVDLVFPSTGGSVDVRLKAGLTEGAYSATGTATSGATTSNVTLNGTVSAPPVNCSSTSIFSDDFSGNLSKWSNNSDWNVSAGEMKHDATGSGKSYNYASVGTFDLENTDFEWQFRLRNGDWDPSSSNKFWFYVSANSLNFSNSNLIDGYAVGVNMDGISDMLSLYKVTDGSGTAIITSSFDWNSNGNVLIRVTRSKTGSWSLYYDPGTGTEVNAGTILDATYSTDGKFFGPNFEYSSTRAGKFFVDDVNICGATLAPVIYEPTVNTCQSVTVNIPSGTEFVDILKDGDIIAQINPNDATLNNLGNTAIDVYKSSTARTDGDNTYYLNRSIYITPEFSNETPVTVRLFITQAEYDQLVTDATNGNDPDVPGTINDLNITKVSGITCAGSNGNFTSGSSNQLISPTAVAYGNGYYLEFQLSSFSGFFMHGGASVLPVEWKRIHVETKNQNNIIHWEVANEQNVERYSVESSINGKDWIKIGNVAFDQNTDFYSFSDTNHRNALIYYRVKQIDFDGQFTFSEIVSARRNSNPINLYPNPIKWGQDITLDCTASCTIKIYNSLGAQVNISPRDENGTIIISTQSLNRGIYYVQINDQVQKLIIN